MKRAVIFKKFFTVRTALGVVAKCAGVASYVTLVFLLTQKNLSDQAAQEAKAALESKNQIERVKASLRSQQASFVAKIIHLHRPEKRDIQKLAEIIVDESEKASYDPLFVAAVIRSESMFKDGAISSRGAKGLMQLMPATGKYISQKENIALNKAEDLHDPVTNVRLGIAYLKYLENKFKGNRERVLLAYNWGPANVALFMRGEARPPSHSIQYAHKIIAAHSQWEDEFSRHSGGDNESTSVAMLG